MRKAWNKSDPTAITGVIFNINIKKGVNSDPPPIPKIPTKMPVMKPTVA